VIDITKRFSSEKGNGIDINDSQFWEKADGNAAMVLRPMSCCPADR